MVHFFNNPVYVPVQVALNRREPQRHLKIMGMSIDAAPTVDLAMIAAGGQEFLERLAKYNASKAAMEEATERFGVARDVAAERDQLGRDVASWNEEKAADREKHLAKIATEKASFDDWIKATRDAESKARNTAEGLQVAAESRHAALDQRERELAAREAALDERVRQIKTAAEADHAKRMQEIAKL
jgi:hypothetical protein